MAWVLTKEFVFDYAHMLPHHDGKCKRLHGHRGVGRVIVKDSTLHTTGPKQGMVLDYSDIKKVLNPIVDEYLDHHYLNDSLQLENPTAEEIARWVFDMLKPKLPQLVAVEIDETCTSSCRYEP